MKQANVETPVGVAIAIIAFPVPGITAIPVTVPVSVVTTATVATPILVCVMIAAAITSTIVITPAIAVVVAVAVTVTITAAIVVVVVAAATITPGMMPSAAFTIAGIILGNEVVRGGPLPFTVTVFVNPCTQLCIMGRMARIVFLTRLCVAMLVTGMIAMPPRQGGN